MLLAIVTVAASLALLLWSAERFISGAAASARILGMSPMLVGLTVVGFGTSAPELLVSVFAAAQGNPGLGIGNGLGSNIANIGLVLGATAALAPLTVTSRTLRRELPVMLGSVALAAALLWDAHLSRGEGILLIVTLCGVLGWFVRDALNSPRGDPLRRELEAEVRPAMPLRAALGWLLAGLVLLLLSTRALVWGAVQIAAALGVSDLVIGLTVVAIGTSTPELAASVASAFKREHDIALGNVIGSNVFNTLGVVGLAGLLHPATVPGAVVTRDLPVVMVLSVALLVMARGWRGAPGRINRLEGSVLLGVFLAYQLWLYL